MIIIFYELYNITNLFKDLVQTIKMKVEIKFKIGLKYIDMDDKLIF